MANLDLTVRINGVNFTGDTLAQARVVRGREDMYSVAQPAYASIDLFDKDGTGFPIEATQFIEIDIEDDGLQLPLFTGSVSDISVQHVATIDGSRSIWSITATSFLSRMNRRQILFDGAPEELDGVRAARILNAGTATSWEEFPILAWEDTGNLRFSTIDFPNLVPVDGGDFLLAALPPSESGYNAYSLLSDVITSSGGSIAELPNGIVLYLSGTTRFDLLELEGPIQLPENVIQNANFGTLQQSSDIINTVEVEYADGVVEDQNGTTIALYGRRASVLRTILARESDAVERASNIISNFARPRFKLPAITFAAHADPQELGGLAALVPSFPVDTGPLPPTLGAVSQEYFVEGIEWELGPGIRNCRLYISDSALSLNAIRWRQAPHDLAWEDVAAILQWQDTRSL